MIRLLANIVKTSLRSCRRARGSCRRARGSCRRARGSTFIIGKTSLRSGHRRLLFFIILFFLFFLLNQLAERSEEVTILSGLTFSRILPATSGFIKLSDLRCDLGVRGLGFRKVRVQGLGFRVQTSGFKLSNLRCDLGFGVWGLVSGFRVQGLGFRGYQAE